jgi:hypothetical protein
MNVLLLLALVCFLSGAVVAGIQKAWPVTLLCLGLAFAALADTGILVS